MPPSSLTPNVTPAAETSWWLITGLLRRDLQDRYAGTAAGLGWAVLQPVMMLALYAFVFAFIFRIRLPGADSALAYVVFVAVTLWPWFLLQESLQRAMAALRAQATLVRKTTLRRDLPVLVAVLSSTVVHLAGYVMVLLCLALAGAEFKASGTLLWALLIAMLFFCVLALALVSSLAQLIWRDLEHAIQPVLMILFYATPILYPLSLVPAEMRNFFAWNPMAWWAERVRAALMEGAQPERVDVIALVAVVILFGLCRRLYLRVALRAEDLL